MKIILALIIVLCTILSAHAQIITVSDATKNKVLDGATIMNLNGSAFSVTNSVGQASLIMFADTDILEIRMLGYSTKRMSMQELSNAGFKVSLTRADFELDQVVISASRRVERDRLVVNRIRRIDANFIAMNNPQTAADLLGQSGEVFIQKSQQGGGSPMIRGFSSNRLLIAVDGVRMNNAIFRSGNLQNVISVDPFAVQSAEVLFGPGSVIYGSDAIGGVMSFQTLTPQLSLNDETIVKGSTALRYASANGEVATHIDASAGGQKWGALTSFTYTKFGNLRMGNNNGPDDFLRTFSAQRINDTDVKVTNPNPLVQLGSAYEQTNFMQKIRYKPNKRWDINYGLHYTTTGDVGRYDRLTELRDGEPRDAEWYYGPQIWFMNHLNIAYTGSTALFDQVSVSLAVQRFEESRNNRNFGSVDKSMRTEKVDAYSANADFTKLISSTGQLTYGVEAIYNDVNSVGIGQNIITGETRQIDSRYPQSTWESYAVYAAYRHELSQGLHLHGGLRYNYFGLNSQFDTVLTEVNFTEASLSNGSLTYSLGLSYETEDKWWFRASMATGFRAPNVDDIGKFFAPPSGVAIVPNPNLTAEYATNFELSIAKLFAERIRLEITGYYTLLDNAMVVRPYTLNGQDSLEIDGETLRINAVQNAAKATVYGVQGAIEVKIGGGFSFLSRFNYQKGEEELNNGETSPSRHAAPWFGKTVLAWKNDKLTLELSSLYSGEVAHENLAFEERTKDFIYPKDANGNNYSPSWYNVNIRAMVPLNETWNISAGIENLTDQRYRTYSSGIAAAGRNIVLAVKANF